MALMLRCADSGAKCPFEVTADTMEELMEHVKIHSKHAHPELAKTPPTAEQIKAMVHQV